MLKDIFACPECLGKLSSANGGVRCDRCGKAFQEREGIIDFYVPGGKGPNYSTVLSNIEYYERAAGCYDNRIAGKKMFQLNSDARISGIFSSVASRKTNGVFLDVGCGTGKVMTIAGRYFETCIGIDISPGMCSLCKKNGFSVHRASADNLPIKNESVDMVSSYALLHHVADPRYMFREIHRVLKKGGYFYTDNDPNFYQRATLEKNLLYRLMRRIYNAVSEERFLKKERIKKEVRDTAEYHHFKTRGLKTGELEDALREAGFGEIRIVPHGDVKSLEKNSFAHCPWYTKINMVLAGLTGFDFTYRRIAPMFLIMAKK
ncbi:MAG: class I SAM-dependent methyltransferase [Candidatus Omnitrophica bacterium]|nr:class I SAM-dependent methyltransferase [Candidatus Omnitrophota bacterium]